MQWKRDPVETSWTLEIHPDIYKGGALRGALNESSKYHAHWKICALITYDSLYFRSRQAVFFPD